MLDVDRLALSVLSDKRIEPLFEYVFCDPVWQFLATFYFLVRLSSEPWKLFREHVAEQLGTRPVERRGYGFKLDLRVLVRPEDQLCVGGLTGHRGYALYHVVDFVALQCKFGRMSNLGCLLECNYTEVHN